MGYIDLMIAAGALLTLIQWLCAIIIVLYLVWRVRQWSRDDDA